MNTQNFDSFPEGVAEKLKTYVYRLIDPRNGETFYVGMGKGNRVFAHVRDEIGIDDPNTKLVRIREIRRSGLEVSHVIHRHGMDEKTAFEVEAALIDAYPGLTNAIGGVGSGDYGAMHTCEIIARYRAKVAIFRHKIMLICVNKSATEISLYEATRYAWKVNKITAQQAEIILAVFRGLIVGAFVAHEWLEATPMNFPIRDGISGRYGFIGEEASVDIKELYIGRVIPEQYRKKGASNPIKYTWLRGTKNI